jgi:hypothetical protein
VRDRVHFCTRDPNRVEPGLGAGFIFHLRVHPKPGKNLKPERNLKNLKPERNLKKTQNPKETLKNPERNPKPPERNPFIKPDGHPNPTQNPMGLGAKFHPRVWVRMSNSTRLYFFVGHVFDRPDLNPTRCHP